jgi:hypothetical protein
MLYSYDSDVRNECGVWRVACGGWQTGYLQLGGGPAEVERVVGRGPAARVPDGGALQEHLLAVAERVAALGAARARRVEVVVLARLHHTLTHSLCRLLSSSIKAVPDRRNPPPCGPPPGSMRINGW